MKRLRGRNTGEHLKPHQFANNWITARTDDGRHVVVSPLAVQLDPEDRAMFEATTGSQHVGSFWREFELREDGRFVRRARASDPRRGTR